MPRRAAALLATIVVALLAAGALAAQRPSGMRSSPAPTCRSCCGRCPSRLPQPRRRRRCASLSSRSYASIGDVRYVVGEVINGRTSSAYSVQVAATFYDAANTLVAEEEGYALLTRMLPGQKAPFRILLSQAPPSIVRYELTVTWQNSSALDYRPATILSQQVRDNLGLRFRRTA